MAGRHAFVTEVAVDFKHALKAAYHQTFQIKLGSDTPIQRDVQRVVVGNERTGCRTAGNRVHHRGFHFKILLASHEVADGLDDAAAFFEDFARFGIYDQIGITLAVAGFLVFQAVHFIRQRAQGFGQQADLAYAYGQLAVVGFKQHAFCAEDIAQVPVLELFVNLLTNTLVVYVELDLAGNVLQGSEAGLAHVALQHHAACYLNGYVLFFQLFLRQFAVLAVQVTGKSIAAEIVRERYTVLADFSQFFTTNCHDLIFV